MLCPWSPAGVRPLCRQRRQLFRCSRHVEHSRHGFGREDLVTAVGTAAHVEMLFVANGFGMADQKLGSARELDHEGAKRPALAERAESASNWIRVMKAPQY